MAQAVPELDMNYVGEIADTVFTSIQITEQLYKRQLDVGRLAISTLDQLKEDKPPMIRIFGEYQNAGIERKHKYETRESMHALAGYYERNAGRYEVYYASSEMENEFAGVVMIPLHGIEHLVAFAGSMPYANEAFGLLLSLLFTPEPEIRHRVELIIQRTNNMYANALVQLMCPEKRWDRGWQGPE